MVITELHHYMTHECIGADLYTTQFTPPHHRVVGLLLKLTHNASVNIIVMFLY